MPTTPEPMSALAMSQVEAEARKARDVQAKETLIQHPETGEFLRGAMVEAAYQREKWPEQDTAKQHSDWFWTLSYITGKALRPDVTDEDRLHHIEAAAALLANWHQAILNRPCSYCGVVTGELGCSSCAF